MWSDLVSLLKAKGTFAGPEEAASRRTNWEALEAARLLATHAEITASLLLARADGMRGADAKEVYYAMGRCSTDKAVEALRHRALAETTYWMAASLVYALAAAGEKGEAVLGDQPSKVGSEVVNLTRAGLGVSLLAAALEYDVHVRSADAHAHDPQQDVPGLLESWLGTSWMAILRMPGKAMAFMFCLLWVESSTLSQGS